MTKQIYRYKMPAPSSRLNILQGGEPLAINQENGHLDVLVNVDPEVSAVETCEIKALSTDYQPPEGFTYFSGARVGAIYLCFYWKKDNE